MKEKTLSIFIDESGDFGTYESHNPFYVVSMVIHDQSININDTIESFKALDGRLSTVACSADAVIAEVPGVLVNTIGAL